MRTNCSRWLPMGPLTLALSLLTARADGAWDFVPTLMLTAESDDNARHLPVDQPTSTRAAFDARLRAGRFSDRGEAWVEPRIVADAYADEADRNLEHNDLFLRTRATREMPRAFFAFDSDFRSESVLRSEIDDALEEDLPTGSDTIETDSGAIGTFTDVRDRFGLSMEGGPSLSDRTTLAFDTSWLDVAYESELPLERADFENLTLGMTLTRAVDERNNVAARVYGMDYTAPRNDNNSRALGVEATFERPLTGTVRFSIDVGVVRTEFSYIGAGFDRVDGVSNGFTFLFDIEKQARATTYSLSAGQSVSPGTTGFLAPRDDLRLGVRHRISPRLAFAAGVRAAAIDVGENAVTPPRDYLRTTIEFDWALSERYSLRAGHDRVREDFGVGGGTEIESSSVFVGIRYQGQSRAPSARP